MTQRSGFALILALSCLSLILLTTLATQALLTVEMRAVAAAASAAKLRFDLQQASFLALASLQSSVGRDDVHTFRKDAVDWAAGPGLPCEPLSGSVAHLRWAWEGSDLSLVHDFDAQRRTTLASDAWVTGAHGRGKVPLRMSAEPLGADERMALELGWSPAPTQPRGKGSRGLLTDPVRGGFRSDLSEERNLQSRLGHDVHRTWSGLVSGVDPHRGMVLGGRGVPSPLLAGVAFSVGVFNSRADGRHRIRFHGSGLMWNDLGVPLASSGRGRMLLVELKGAPIVTIRNLDSGAEVEADLDDLSELDLGTLEQGRRERSLWFIAGVDDAAVSPMSSPGLLAGESYAFVSPSPAAQPQGLARILSPVTWRMDRRPHGPGWRRPGPDVMTPADRIHISFRFEGESSVVVRRYVGDPVRGADLDSYAGEVCQTVEGLRFESFVIETNGEDYSRPDSSGYRISERRACVAAFPDANSSDDFLRWRNEARSMRPFLWAERHPLAFGRPEEDHVRRPGDILWDEAPNAHGPVLPLRFGRAVGPEIPLRPVLSSGSLRHLGDPDWTQALDSAAFLPRAGIPSHPRLRTWDGAAGSVASDYFIDGAFNINATASEEWVNLLWSAGAVPFSPAAAAFPTRPSTVDVPLTGLSVPRPLEDHEVDRLEPSALGETVLSQPVRLLSRTQIERLAEGLAAEVARCGPFPSLAAFHESGVMERAITSASLNIRVEDASGGIAFRLSSADIMELFSPQLAVRGDTFHLRVAVSGEHGRASVSLIVQRTASTEGLPAHLGRRLKIMTINHP